MKIAIIGGGSLGLLYSYYLSLMHEVHLYTRTEKQSELINAQGLFLIKDGETAVSHNIAAAPIHLWSGGEDMTIVCVKQYQLQDLIKELEGKSAGNILFLQNGFGHIKLLSGLAISPVFVGSVEHGAAKSNGNTVFHNGVGVTRAAVFNGGPGLLAELSLSLPSDFPIILESDYYEMLTKKLVVNSVINPLTAALKVKNGALITNPYYFDVFVNLFEECAQILELPDKEEYFRNVIAVCEKTASNHSSMYKDIENGRQTEIDAILGYLLEESKRKNMQAPLIHNYYQCIKGKEHEREEA